MSARVTLGFSWKPDPKDYKRRAMTGQQRRQYDAQQTDLFDKERTARMRVAVLRMGDAYQGLRDFSKAMLLYHT